MRRESDKSRTRQPGDDLDALARVLGLPPELVAGYRLAVATASFDIPAMAARLGIPVAEADEIVAALAAEGLVSPVSGGAARFVATSPAAVLGARVDEQQQRLAQAHRGLSSLTEMYELAVDAAIGGDASQVVEVLRGTEAVAQGFARVQASARREVQALVGHPAAVTSSSENAAEDEAVARGVQYPVVIERALLGGADGEWARLTAASAAGEEVRVVDSVPMKLTVVDREIAFLPVLADPGLAGAAAMVVRSGALLAGLLALFDYVWDSASPVRGGALGGDVPLDAFEAEVLSLLMAGYTDDATSRMLGVSVRTVQRRVSELMERTGSSTRLQLGWHAARHRWLE